MHQKLRCGLVGFLVASMGLSARGDTTGAESLQADLDRQAARIKEFRVAGLMLCFVTIGAGVMCRTTERDCTELPSGYRLCVEKDKINESLKSLALIAGVGSLAFWVAAQIAENRLRERARADSSQVPLPPVRRAAPEYDQQ